MQSLRATARPNANQFAVYNLTSRVAAGTTYAVSALGVPHRRGERHGAPGRPRSDAAPAATPIPWLQNNTAVVAEHLDAAFGNLAIPAGCTVVDVAIFLEGTPVGPDVFVDDVSVTAP